MNAASPRLATVVSGLVTLMTVAGFLVTAWGTTLLPLAITLGLAALAAEVWANRNVFRATRHYSFKNDHDIRLGGFFQDWYGREGHHYVFCNDLQWLEPVSMAGARQVLVSLGNRLDVYLTDETGPTCSDIKTAGGRIHLLPTDKMTDQAPRMSFIDDGVDPAVAIRFKSQTDRVIFNVSKSEDHLIKLARAFIAIQS